MKRETVDEDLDSAAGIATRVDPARRDSPFRGKAKVSCIARASSKSLRQVSPDR